MLDSLVSASADSAVYADQVWGYVPTRYRDASATEESIERDESPFTLDLSALPGENATIEVLRDEETRDRLIDLIGAFHKLGYSSSMDQQWDVSAAAARAAEFFIRALPRGLKLPRVAPGDEGGVVLAWTSTPKTLLLQIGSHGVDGVLSPGSADAAYFENLSLDTGRLPDVIVQAIRAL